MPEAIVVDAVTKRFTLRHAHSIKEMTVRAMRRQSLSEPFSALEEVSLTVREGESVALMGLNGSGKSTLLKLISGVMQPDLGSVRVRGRVAGLIEVGAGLHPDLTGHENIFLNAAILGMSKAETEAKYDAIVEFSGIHTFLDTQVKFYSSGMFMRLGFSVAVHTEPDIFLVDEVLAVGDPPFQKKCLERIRGLREDGRTLVIVAHDMNTLTKVCDRGVVLRSGQVAHDGGIREAVNTFAPPAAERRPAPRDSRPLYYLAGLTGFPNYGDELIAGSWLRHLAEVAPEADVWLDCPHPGPAGVRLGGLHPRARFTDTFWRLCEAAPSDDPAKVAEFVGAALAEPSRAPRWTAGIELARRADVAHVIGGGYVNGIWPRNVGVLALAAALRRAGRRAVLTGQGLTPSPPGAESLLRDLVSGFEIVDVRDGPSADLLGPDLSVSCTGDDALLGLGPHLYRSGDAPEVMICAQSDLLDMPLEALAAFLRDTLREWGVAPGDVGFAEAIPGADRRIFELVERDLPGVRFYTAADILDNGLPAAPGQCWLSTRFHPHLVAASAGASGVAVSINRDYYTTKHRSLIERGSGWRLATGLVVPPRPSSGGFDPAALAVATDAKAALAAKIYP